MKIYKIEYKEFSGKPNQWSVDQFQLGDFNLLVGKNSAGKTRLLNLISGLAKLLSTEQKVPYEDGEYKIEFVDGADKYVYELCLGARVVNKESLHKNEQLLFERDSFGAGKIWAEKASVFFEFSVPNELLVVGSRRDKIQHSFMERLHSWAKSLKHYRFANSFLQENHAAFHGLLSLEDRDEFAFEVGKIHEVYAKGYELFGENFDSAILKDFNELGYSCDDVGVEQLNLPQFKGLPAATLFVKEVDLNSKTIQVFMSQGMFRALALVIELNFLVFTDRRCTVLIDDIGEGLDFERAKQFVFLLRAKATSQGLQLIATTNDRFVMNSVPLDQWGVVDREGHHVRVVNSQNSPKLFEEFSFIGLSNFDFFAENFYSEKVK